MTTTVKCFTLSKLNIALAAGILATAIEGCASKPVVEEKLADAKQVAIEQKADTTQAIAVPSVMEPAGPEWTRKGNGAFQDAGKNVFYGVGIVSGVSNKALAISTADDRARVEISKIIKTYVANLNKDYQASIGNGKEETGEQNIRSAIKTFSSATLNGATIIDRWTDPADGTIYSLAKLDFDSVKSAFPLLKGIAANAKEYYMQNADRAFAELAAEEQKAKGQNLQQGSAVAP